MPTFTFTAPDGRKLKVTGDTPPSEAEVDAMFAQAKGESSKPARTWTDTAVDALPMAGGMLGSALGGIGGTAFGFGFGGVPGAVGGATLGGSAGEAFKQLVNRARGADAPTTPAQAAGDIATAGAIQGGSELVGQGVVKAAPVAARAVYRGFLKPSLAKNSIAKADDIVETALKEGLPLTKAGKETAAAIQTDIRNEVNGLLKSADQQGETVDLHFVAQQVRRFAQRKYFKPGVPSADYDAAMRVADSLDLHPSLKTGVTDVTLSKANTIKQAIDESIGDANFGIERGATKTAQKVARMGLRKDIETAATAAGQFDVGPLNAREGRLLDAAKAIARGVGREANKNQLTGWTPLIAGGVVGMSDFARNRDPYSAAVKAIATRVALDPAVASRAAIVAYRLGNNSGAGPANVARLAVQAVLESQHESGDVPREVQP